MFYFLHAPNYCWCSEIKAQHVKVWLTVVSVLVDLEVGVDLDTGTR